MSTFQIRLFRVLVVKYIPAASLLRLFVLFSYFQARFAILTFLLAIARAARKLEIDLLESARSRGFRQCRSVILSWMALDLEVALLSGLRVVGFDAHCLLLGCWNGNLALMKGGSELK